MSHINVDNTYPIHFEVSLYAATLLECILITAFVLPLALFDFVHLHVPLPQSIGVQHIFTGVAATKRDE